LREIVFDTETTGLDPTQGHRIVEIGCVEIVDRFPTGRTWHSYLNPERDIPPDAFAIHGLSGEFLRDKPKFSDLVSEFLEFVGSAQLVAHNGFFDLEFVNSELSLAKRNVFTKDRIIDTLSLAKRKHRNQKNSLDDLCKRYRIDTSKRTKHGALLDAELLAEVYIELTGGRQTSLLVESTTVAKEAANSVVRRREKPLAPRLTAEDVAAHLAFVGTLGKEPVWGKYVKIPEKAA
jgi:DNA polymerase-3 subunit epsilon